MPATLSIAVAEKAATKKGYDDIWKRKKQESQFEKVITTGRIGAASKILGKGEILLDVGCGDGSLLALSRKNYKRTLGADITRNALEIANGRGLSVIQADLGGTLPVAGKSVDTVTCLDVLEHIVDPLKFLDEINRVLKPGGSFIVSVPNLGYYKHRLSVAMGKFPETSGDKELFDGGHLHYFTYSTLENLLRKHGFGDITSYGIDRNVLPQLLSMGILLKARKKRERR